jgi:hypothetical protein
MITSSMRSYVTKEFHKIVLHAAVYGTKVLYMFEYPTGV